MAIHELTKPTGGGEDGEPRAPLAPGERPLAVGVVDGLPPSPDQALPVERTLYVAKLEKMVAYYCTGATVAQVASAFGMTQAGVRSALKSPEAEKLHAEIKGEILDRASALHYRILSNLEKVVSRELMLATNEDSEGASLDIPLTNQYAQKARHYFMDLVFTKAGEHFTKADPSGGIAAAAVGAFNEARDLLRTLSEAAAVRTRDIQQSPFVREGEDAVVNAMTVKRDHPTIETTATVLADG